MVSYHHRYLIELYESRLTCSSFQLLSGTIFEGRKKLCPRFTAEMKSPEIRVEDVKIKRGTWYVHTVVSPIASNIYIGSGPASESVIV
jgi:hypothetical protein